MRIQLGTGNWNANRRLTIGWIHYHSAVERWQSWETTFSNFPILHTLTHTHCRFLLSPIPQDNVRLRLHIIIIYKYNTRCDHVLRLNLVLASCHMEICVSAVPLAWSVCLPLPLILSRSLFHFCLSCFRLTVCGVNKFKRFMHKLLRLHINNRGREKRSGQLLLSRVAAMGLHKSSYL